MAVQELFDEPEQVKSDVRSSQTYSSTLNVTMQDQDLNQYVLKIKEPLENLSRTTVTAAFAPVLGSGTSGKRILYSRANSPFTEIGQIQYVEVTTVKTDVV